MIVVFPDHTHLLFLGYMLCILRCTIVKWFLRTDMPGISLHDELVDVSKLTFGSGLGCTLPDINRSKEITQTMQ